MKKFSKLAAILAAAVLAAGFVSCGSDDDGSDTTPVIYTVTYTTEKGTAPKAITVDEGTKLTAAQLPALTADGYTFSGWYDGETKAVAGAYAVTKSVTLTAKWTASTDTAYKVEHYQQNIDNDEYAIVTGDTQNLTGTTGETTNAAAKTYAGFTAKTFSQGTIAANGSTVVKIYYDRNTVTLTFNANGGTWGDGSTTDKMISGKYGATVNAPALPTKTGYNAAWDKTVQTTFAADETYTATFTAGQATYTVKHLQQNADDDGYTEVTADKQTLSGTTGGTTAAQAKTYEHFTAQTITQKTIAADGTTVVEIKYTRGTATITFDTDGGSAVEAISGKWGATYTKPANPTKAGYDFGAWNPTLPEKLSTMTAKATWTAVYTVTYADGVSDTEITMPVDSAKYKAGDTVTVKFDGIGTRAGYEFAGWSDGTTTYTINGTKTLTMGTVTVTLTAQWEATRNPAVGKIGMYEKPYAVGDIVFSDGSATPYASDLTLTDDQKSKAIAVIFYAGTGAATSGSNENILGEKTLGVGIHNTQGETTKTYAWAPTGTTGCTTQFGDEQNIQLGNSRTTPAEGMPYYLYKDPYIGYSYYVTGDFDGSDNWAEICKQDAAGTAEGSVADKYPAFNWVNNYASKEESHVSGMEYADEWYLPSGVELRVMYDNKSTVNASLEAAGGTKIADTRYWSSSQQASDIYYAGFVAFDRGYFGFSEGESLFCVCLTAQKKWNILLVMRSTRNKRLAPLVNVFRFYRRSPHFVRDRVGYFLLIVAFFRLRRRSLSMS